MAHRGIFISGVHFQNWMPVGAGNSLEGQFFISPIPGSSSKHRHYHHQFSNGVLLDAAAIQIKLNELIRVSKAHNSFVGVERLTDEEITEIRAKCEEHAKQGCHSRHSFEANNDDRC